MKNHFIHWIALVCMVTVPAKVGATTYVSNLGNLWPISGTIGDLHAVKAGNAIVGRFTTGATAGALNFVSVELLLSTRTGAGYPGPQPWDNIMVQLYQQTGTQYNLLRTLVNPTINPTPTQWPTPKNIFYTAYVDFKPNWGISLNPFSDYLISVGVPPGGAGMASLFTPSFDYVTPTDWQMGVTSTATFDGRRTISNLSTTPAYNQAMKFAVDATVVPEPSSLVLVGLAGSLLFTRLARKSGPKALSRESSQSA